MCLEGYIELLIAGYINYYFSLDSTNGEVGASYLAYYCLIVSLIIMPIVMIYIIMQDSETVRSENFSDKWGVLYEGLKTESRWQYASNGVFMLRRLLFIMICFLLIDFPSLQILFLNLLNLLMLIYTGYFCAYVGRLRNRMNLFNETSIVCISWHLMFFANEDYLPDSSMQFNMGYSMALCIGINLVVNYAVIFYFGCLSIGLVCLKYYKLWRFVVYGDDPENPDMALLEIEDEVAVE